MSTPPKKDTIQATTFHNLTGEFNATFPNSADPGGVPFTRAPYLSQGITCLVIFGNYKLDFDSSAGTNVVNSIGTSDRRRLRIAMEPDITSGVHTLPHSGTGKIITVEYGEMEKTGERYDLRMFTASEATLDLEVSSDGRRYTSKNFDIKIVTTAGTLLNIKADFDIYLTLT